MQDYQINISSHKRVRDPELAPFLIEKKLSVILGVLLILVPVLITAILTLSVIFLDQFLILFLLISVGLILFFAAIILAHSTYKQLKQFRITGSVFQDLYRLIESFGFRIQAALFPLIFLLFIFSILFSGAENDGTSDLISSGLQLFGAIIPFLSIILILNTFMNYLDEYNNRVSSLADRSPEEDFRKELKDWGRTLGFSDVKIRLADLQPNYYGRLAISAELDNIVFIGYSKIAQYQAERDQSLVFCVREICRLSLEKRLAFYLLYSIHNILFTLYLALSGVLILSLSADTIIIQEANIIFCILAIIVLIIADALLKTYISSFDILLELKTDQKTVEVLTTEFRSAESIRRYLRLTEKVDPLMTAYPGFKFRRLALLEEKERRTIWDDL